MSRTRRHVASVHRNISFSVPADAEPHILTILRRAQGLGVSFDKMSARMDLCATHANGCPMDFDRLAAADDFNLIHDFCGILNCMDRSTGFLTRGFFPRFAQKQFVAA